VNDTTLRGLSVTAEVSVNTEFHVAVRRD